MYAQIRHLMTLSGFVLCAAWGGWCQGQTTDLQGDVKDSNGQPVLGAVIILDRIDVKGHYQVRTLPSGHWRYAGLPQGTYDITCNVHGKVMGRVTGVQTRSAQPVNFTLENVKISTPSAAPTSPVAVDPALAAKFIGNWHGQSFCDGVHFDQSFKITETSKGQYHATEHTSGYSRDLRNWPSVFEYDGHLDNSVSNTPTGLVIESQMQTKIFFRFEGNQLVGTYVNHPVCKSDLLDRDN